MFFAGWLAGTAQADVLYGPKTNASNGHSYYMLSSQSWIAAQAEAVSLGGNLTTIRSAQENQWLLDTFAHWDDQSRTFWIGLNLILVFAVILGVLPVAGYQPLSEGLWENLRYLVLPAVTLGFYDAALLARMTRSMMLGVLKENYVRTARSIGLPERRVVLGHALRNALIPLLTIVGLIFAGLLGGALVTETVFNIPGVGRLLIQAVLRRDYQLVQGIVLVIAAAYVLINLSVDILYGLLDPRVSRSTLPSA